MTIMTMMSALRDDDGGDGDGEHIVIRDDDEHPDHK